MQSGKVGFYSNYSGGTLKFLKMALGDFDVYQLYETLT